MSDTRRRPRIAAGLLAGAAGLMLIGSTFAGWITTRMVGGGRTSISGWGVISGGDPLVDGTNLNTLMAGMGSYRPALPVLIAGAVTVVAAAILTATGAGARPHRTVGVLLGLCGLFAAGWSVAKGLDPGDAVGVLPDGAGAAGVGPVIAAVSGLVIAAVAAVLLAGLLDPPEPAKPPGVQPRR